MEAKVVFILIFSIVYSTIVRSTATPQLITLPEMYEVRDGEAFELHHDSVRGQGKTKVNLERLEVVRNDLVSGLPFESCIEEKMARVNKYAVSDGHNSRFEEVHQVGTGGGGGYCWEFLVEVCRPDLNFKPKEVIFYTRFQTWPL